MKNHIDDLFRDLELPSDEEVARETSKVKRSLILTQQWKNNDERRQSVSQWASSLERTEEHCAKISDAGKRWYADPENAKLRQQLVKSAGYKISKALGGKPKTKKTLCCWCSTPMPNHIHQRHENSCKLNPNKKGKQMPHK